MAESVAELLSRLRFVGGPVETLYLNQARAHDNFISNIGEVESFTRTAGGKSAARHQSSRSVVDCRVERV